MDFSDIFAKFAARNFSLRKILTFIIAHIQEEDFTDAPTVHSCTPQNKQWTITLKSIQARDLIVMCAHFIQTLKPIYGNM